MSRCPLAPIQPGSASSISTSTQQPINWQQGVDRAWQNAKTTDNSDSMNLSPMVEIPYLSLPSRGAACHTAHHWLAFLKIEPYFLFQNLIFKGGIGAKNQPDFVARVILFQILHLQLQKKCPNSEMLALTRETKRQNQNDCVIPAPLHLLCDLGTAEERSIIPCYPMTMS